jgi:hypothetical protein
MYDVHFSPCTRHHARQPGSTTCLAIATNLVTLPTQARRCGCTRPCTALRIQGIDRHTSDIHKTRARTRTHAGVCAHACLRSAWLESACRHGTQAKYMRVAQARTCTLSATSAPITLGLPKRLCTRARHAHARVCVAAFSTSSVRDALRQERTGKASAPSPMRSATGVAAGAASSPPTTNKTPKQKASLLCSRTVVTFCDAACKSNRASACCPCSPQIAHSDRVQTAR